MTIDESVRKWVKVNEDIDGTTCISDVTTTDWLWLMVPLHKIDYFIKLMLYSKCSYIEAITSNISA